VTNNHSRDVLRWWDLSDKERTDLDYIDTEDKQDSAEFGRYKGVVYDLHDMERDCGCGGAMPTPFEAWDNYISDSFFSGILIRWIDDGERVIFGRYYS
jgi:hypothetical protein